MQALASKSQATELLEWLHPVTELQTSAVQLLPSSQLTAVPPTHTPPVQVSLVVQALPSLQAAVVLVAVHEDVPLHARVMQPSALFEQVMVVPWQEPPLQVSL